MLSTFLHWKCVSRLVSLIQTFASQEKAHSAMHNICEALLDVEGPRHCPGLCWDSGSCQLLPSLCRKETLSLVPAWGLRLKGAGRRNCSVLVSVQVQMRQHSIWNLHWYINIKLLNYVFLLNPVFEGFETCPVLKVRPQHTSLYWYGDQKRQFRLSLPEKHCPGGKLFSLAWNIPSFPWEAIQRSVSWPAYSIYSGTYKAWIC